MYIHMYAYASFWLWIGFFIVTRPFGVFHDYPENHTKTTCIATRPLGLFQDYSGTIPGLFQGWIENH